MKSHSGWVAFLYKKGCLQKQPFYYHRLLIYTVFLASSKAFFIVIPISAGDFTT